MSNEHLHKKTEKMYEILNFARTHGRKIDDAETKQYEMKGESLIEQLISAEYLREINKDGQRFYSLQARGLNLFGENRMKTPISPDLKEEIVKKLVKDLKKLRMKPWEVMLHILQFIGDRKSMNTEEIIAALNQRFPQLKGLSRSNVYRIIQRLRMKGYIEYDKMVYSEQSSYKLGEKAPNILGMSPSRALHSLRSVEKWDAAMKEVFATMEEERIQNEEALFTTIESIPEGLSAEQLLWILYMQGGVYELKQKFDEAEAVYLQMEGLGDELGDVRARSYSLKGMGNVAFKRAKYAVAQQYYIRSQKVARDLEDALLSSDIFNNLGSCSFMNDDVEKATHYFTQALEQAGTDQSRKAMILCNQGLCYARMEQLESARDLWEKSLHIYEELQDTEGIHMVKHNLREIDSRQKKEYLEEQLQKAMETGTTADKKTAYETLVRFHFRTYMEKGGMSS